MAFDCSATCHGNEKTSRLIDRLLSERLFGDVFSVVRGNGLRFAKGMRRHQPVFIRLFLFIQNICSEMKTPPQDRGGADI